MPQPVELKGFYSIWAWVVYPLTMALAFALFFLLYFVNTSVFTFTYVPVFLGIGLVTLSEIASPYMKEWKPNRDEVKTDLIYMTTIQVVLPKVLTFIVAITLLEWLQGNGVGLLSAWPNHWPLGLQAVTMILAADFFRYWLHYFSHKSLFLWRLHAIHHSSKKLYWINVGRFHPIEKAMQFLVDALPFILLGISQEALALYFVFYSVNGFFQHSNVNLKMGWLNYLISGPELHRWHHSRKIRESDTNFGNNIIVWDLLFGTYFNPTNKTVEELGLINRDYPMDYLSQMQTPFTNKIDKKNLPLPNLKDLMLNWAMAFKMLRTKSKLYKPFLRKIKDPKKAQIQLLRSIINQNQDTIFGQEHHFKKIKDYKSFQKNIPVMNYEKLRPYIERQDEEKKPILTSENPFMFNQTSGTTGKPKQIPVLESSILAFKQSQRLSSYFQYRQCPEAFHGKVLGIVSPAIEGYLNTGTPYGSMSGHVYKMASKLIQRKYAVPKTVFEIEDYELKYYLIARLSLEQENITLMASANPSTFHKILEIINKNAKQMIQEIEKGECKGLEQLDARIKNPIVKRISPNPKRAKVLNTILEEKGRLEFYDFWPYLKMVATWTGGSCGISLQSLMSRFPQDIKVMDLGYLSSEFRGTLTRKIKDTGGLPTLDQTFFEFVSQNDREENRHEFKLLHELKEGETYYVFITTLAGLYRYDMNDLLKVTGFFKETPLLQFVQKGKGVTNITGEKLYEGQLIKAMKKAEIHFKLNIKFYQLLANEQKSHYELYLELKNSDSVDRAKLANYIDKQLMELNMEYKTKHSGGRLKPLNLSLLKKGTFEKYKAHHLSKGQRESQFKPMLIQYKKECDFNFNTHAH